MSQGPNSIPPPLPPGFALPVRTSVSAAAVTSLVLGLLLCIPLVTSLSAIAFAVAGMRATRPGAKRGRGLAIAGLVLGVVGILMWLGAGGLMGVVYAGSTAPRALLRDFAARTAAGDDARALALSDPIITRDGLDGMETYIKPFGTYVDLTCWSVNLTKGTAGETCVLAGTMHFSTGNHAFNATLIRNPAGVWKIYGFHVY